MCVTANLKGVLCGNDARLCKPWESKAPFLMFFCHCHGKNFLLVEKGHCEITHLLLSSSGLGYWPF